VGSSRTIAAKKVHAAIARLASEIGNGHPGGSPLWLLGIANGGVPLAYRLADAINANPSSNRRATAGVLDISFHRDDLGQHPIPKEFTPTALPGDVTGAAVILVDDVLFTGRTAKASLDELFDHGRPSRVQLAVLVDRGGRRLPIAPDFVGMTLEAGEEERVVVQFGENPARDRIAIRRG
jgi:pyrimidine operon attenuation protein / uracil phosphoribosyltransferase